MNNTKLKCKLSHTQAELLQALCMWHLVGLLWKGNTLAWQPHSLVFSRAEAFCSCGDLSTQEKCVMGECIWLKACLYFARLVRQKKILSLPTNLASPEACPSFLFGLPRMQQFRQALGIRAAVAVFIIPDATAMRQTFLCEVYDFSQM